MAKRKTAVVVNVTNVNMLKKTLRKLEGRITRLFQKAIADAVEDIVNLDKHYRNRIAAHKAHVTMAKQKIKRLPAAQGGFRADAVIIGYQPKGGGR